MIPGTSALQTQYQNQISTPKIRLTMTENWFVSSVGQTTYFAGGNISQAARFNNNFVFGTTTHDIYQVDSTGQSLVSQANLSNADLTLFSNILNLGSTLSLISYSVGHTFYRSYSTNGITWGGTEVLFCPGISKKMYKIIQTTADNFYFLYGASSSGFKLGSGTNVGNTWINGVTFDRATYLGSVFPTAIPQFTAYRSPTKDYDVLYLNAGSTTNASWVSRRGMDLYKYRSDGINIFSRETDTLSRSSQDTVFIGDIAKGNSYYYMPHVMTKTSYRIINGSTVVLTERHNLQYLRSSDLENWTTSIDMGISQNSIIPQGLVDLAVGKRPIMGALASGASFELMIASATILVTMIGRQKSVDISDDILNYTNRNNNRISIMLSNYDI